MNSKFKAQWRTMPVMASCCIAFCGVVLAEEREPSRRELWVPTQHLDEVLKQHPHAVLLDRAQYERLIRDAGRTNPEGEESRPPLDAVIEGAKIHADLIGGAQKITTEATLTVNVLGDRWAEVPLLSLPAGVVMTKFDGGNVKLKQGGPGELKSQTVLAIRGKGRHQVTMQFQSPLRRTNRICSAMLPCLAQPCLIQVTPHGSVEVSERWPMCEGRATVPVVPSGGTGIKVTWAERPAANATGEALISQTADCLATVHSSGVTNLVRVRSRSSGGTLPKILKFKLSGADANVIAVDDLNIASWKQEGTTLEVERRDGFRDTVEFDLVLLQPAPDGEGKMPLVIEVPKLEGAMRVGANIGLSVVDDFDMTGWQTPGTEPDKAFHNYLKSKKTGPGETILAHYEVVPGQVVAAVRRRGNHFSADVDNRIALSTHDVTMERTLAFRGEEGRVNRTMLVLPAGEQFLGINAVSGERVEWKQVEGSADTPVSNAQTGEADRSVRAPVFEIIWPDGLQKGQVSTLGLKTRRDLSAATGEGKATEKLAFENLKLPEAIRLAGYVALDFDDSWKVAATETTALEPRDARVTPVKGRMAWFALRDYKLALDISRNDAVLDAAVIAYVLPRAKNVEIEGQVVLAGSRAPLRKFDVKLPVATANLLRWDSPLIGEQMLDAATGTWHLTLRKELLGTANVRFHLSLPADQKQQSGDETNNQEPGTRNQVTTLSSTLPSFEFPTARRFTGTWVVEANSDTELSYETKGLQPLDAQHAPVVEGYSPRHRVLAAYGYGSNAHELRISATRHEPGALVSAVVNEMKLISVIGRDGVSRHEAALLVKHNGQQFFGLRLPGGAAVLSARAAGQAVKPVRAGVDEVRIPLPVNQSADTPVWLVVAYELRGPAWSGSGTAKLVPPAVNEGVPVLSSSWRVFTPDGMETSADGGPGREVDPLGRATLSGQLASYLDLLSPSFSKISNRTEFGFLPGGNGGEREIVKLKPKYPEPIFVGMPVSSISNAAGGSRNLEEKMSRIIFPSVQFRGASIAEAIEFLRINSKELDSREQDPAKRGVSLILRAGQAPSTAQITLDLKDVPMLEALRYVTELAGMKYEIEPDAVVVVPVTDVAAEHVTGTFNVSADFLGNGQGSAKNVLQAAGIPFPDGTSAQYVPAESILVVKNTQPNLDAIGALLGHEREAAGDQAQPGKLDHFNKGWKEQAFASGKSGLISLELEVPATGRIFEFRGNQRPGMITLRYESWERQMRQSVLWTLLGLLLFFIAGRRRAWLRMIVVALLLTCVPLAFAPSWLTVSNAVLAGWLVGFVVWLAWRIARWLEGKWAHWTASPSAISGLSSSAVLLLFSVFSFQVSAYSAAEKPDPASHSVVVPYDLGQPRNPERANRYYLDYAEFQKLWELAKENRRPAKPDEADATATPEAFINSALYDARVEDDKLVVAARFSVLTRGAKWAKLPLPFKGDGLSVAEVELDGGAAQVLKGEILIENPGAHAVEVIMQVARDRGWKEAELEIPPAPLAAVAVSVPATDGRPVLGGTRFDALVTEEARDGMRVFTLPLGSVKTISIKRTPGRKLAVDVAPAQADTKLTLRVLPRLEKISAETAFSFPGTERRKVTMELDQTLRLDTLAAVPAAQATLRKDSGRQVIDLEFPQAVADSAKVFLTAERVFDSAKGSRTVPVVSGTAIRSGSVVELQFSDDLQMKVDSADVERIVTATGGPGAGSYRIPADKTLRYTVTGAEDRSRARVEAVYQFTAQKSEIIAAITLDSGRAPLANARIGVPAAFEVQTLTGPRLRSWHREGAFLVLGFDTQPDPEAKLVLHLARTLAQPTASWKIEPLKLPQFARHDGVAFIAVHAADEVKLSFDGADRKVREVDPGSVTTVVSVASPFQLKRALSVEKGDWSADVTLTRQVPRFSADTILLARAGDLGLSLSQQVGLVIEQGAVGSVKVRLPKSLPEARVHGALVRDTQSRIAGESREYEISFQTEALDRADFTMDFELPLEGEKNLPLVQVDGAARIRRFVIADNSGAREMKLDAGGAETAAKESLPYLPEGLTRPQYLRASETSAVKLSFTQLESTAGNAAIITLAEITTALRADGERWETVVYSLANRSLQFLPVKLPARAELIEVSVGGQAVRADVGGSEKGQVKSEKVFLVPLIQMRAGELSQQVKLVYRFAGIRAVGIDHRFQQPELVGLSAERTLWNLWVPEAFAAKHFDGNMEEIGAEGSVLEKLQSDLSEVARLNRVIASGSLSNEETQVAWGNVNKKIAEVRKQQSENRSKSRDRYSEGNDEGRVQELKQMVSQRDSDVDKQLREQVELTTSNGFVVQKAKQQIPVLGDVPVQGQLFQGRGAQQTLQAWSFNNEAAQGRKSGSPAQYFDYAQSGMVDLNDNVSLNGGEFFKTAPQPVAGDIAGSDGVALTKSGAGTLVLGSATGSVQSAVTGNVILSNARAGQSVQGTQRAAGGGTSVAANSTISGGGTLTLNGRMDVVAEAANAGRVFNADTSAVTAGTSSATASPAMPPGDAFGGGGVAANGPTVPVEPFAPPSPVPSAKPASATLPQRVDDKEEPAMQQAAPAPLLKPVGRVSLAIDVPLDGKVYHFSKLKDHAVIEVTIVKPFDDRQTGALWVLGTGFAALLLFEAGRRAWLGRRRVVAL